MNTEKHWLAVYTRPRWEKKVAKMLNNKSIESYCPLNKVMRQWSDRKKIVQEPLITSYVFVNVCEAEYLPIRETDGILNFVYWLGKPAIIKNNEIDALKTFLDDYSNITLEKVEVNVNDEVRVIHGPLVSREGKVIEIQYNHVKIILPSLGFTLIAQVHKTHIEKVRIINKEDNKDNRYAKILSL